MCTKVDFERLQTVNTWECADPETPDSRYSKLRSLLTQRPPQSLLIDPRLPKYRFLRKSLSHLIREHSYFPNCNLADNLLRWALLWWIVTQRHRLRRLWNKLDRRPNVDLRAARFRGSPISRSSESTFTSTSINGSIQEQIIKEKRFREVVDRALNLQTLEMLILHDAKKCCQNYSKVKRVWMHTTPNFEFVALPQLQEVLSPPISSIFHDILSEFPHLKIMLMNISPQLGQENKLLMTLRMLLTPQQVAYQTCSVSNIRKIRSSRCAIHLNPLRLRELNLYTVFSNMKDVKAFEQILVGWIQNNMHGGYSPVAPSLLEKVILPPMFSFPVYEEARKIAALKPTLKIASIEMCKGSRLKPVITYTIWAYLVSPAPIRRLIRSCILEQELEGTHTDRRRRQDRRFHYSGTFEDGIQDQPESRHSRLELKQNHLTCFDVIELCELGPDLWKKFTISELQPASHQEQELRESAILFCTMIAKDRPNNVQYPWRVSKRPIFFPLSPCYRLHSKFYSLTKEILKSQEGLEICPITEFSLDKTTLLFTSAAQVLQHKCKELQTVYLFCGLQNGSVRFGHRKFKTDKCENIDLDVNGPKLGWLEAKRFRASFAATLGTSSSTSRPITLKQKGSLLFWQINAVMKMGELRYLVPRAISRESKSVNRKLTTMEGLQLISKLRASREFAQDKHVLRKCSRLLSWDSLLKLLVCPGEEISWDEDCHRPLEGVLAKWHQETARAWSEQLEVATDMWEEEGVHERLWDKMLGAIWEHCVVEKKTGSRVGLYEPFKPYMSEWGVHLPGEQWGPWPQLVVRLLGLPPRLSKVAHTPPSLLLSRLSSVFQELHKVSGNIKNSGQLQNELCLRHLQKNLLRIMASLEIDPSSRLSYKILFWHLTAQDTSNLTLMPGIRPFYLQRRTVEVQKLAKLKFRHFFEHPDYIEATLASLDSWLEFQQNGILNLPKGYDSEICLYQIYEKIRKSRKPEGQLTRPLLESFVKSLKYLARNAHSKLHRTVRSLNSIARQITAACSEFENREFRMLIQLHWRQARFLLKPEYQLAADKSEAKNYDQHRLLFLSNVLWQYYQCKPSVRDQPELNQFVSTTVCLCLLGRLKLVVNHLLKNIPLFWCERTASYPTSAKNMPVLPYSVFRELSFFLNEVAPAKFDKALLQIGQNPPFSIVLIDRKEPELNTDVDPIAGLVISKNIVEEFQKLAWIFGKQLTEMTGPKPNLPSVGALVRKLIISKQLQYVWGIIETVMLFTPVVSQYSLVLEIMDYGDEEAIPDCLQVGSSESFFGLANLELLIFHNRLACIGSLYQIPLSESGIELAESLNHDTSPFYWNHIVRKKQEQEKFLQPWRYQPEHLITVLHHFSFSEPEWILFFTDQSLQSDRHAHLHEHIHELFFHERNHKNRVAAAQLGLVENSPMPYLGILDEMPLSTIAFRRLVLMAKSQKQYCWLRGLHRRFSDFFTEASSKDREPGSNRVAEWYVHLFAFTAPDLVEWNDPVTNWSFDFTGIDPVILSIIYQNCILNWQRTGQLDVSAISLNQSESQSTTDSCGQVSHTARLVQYWPSDFQSLLRLDLVIPLDRDQFMDFADSDSESDSYCLNPSKFKPRLLRIEPKVEFAANEGRFLQYGWPDHSTGSSVLKIACFSQPENLFSQPVYLHILSDLQEHSVRFSPAKGTLASRFKLWFQSLIKYLEAFNNQNLHKLIVNYTYISREDAACFGFSPAERQPPSALLEVGASLSVQILLPAEVLRILVCNSSGAFSTMEEYSRISTDLSNFSVHQVEFHSNLTNLPLLPPRSVTFERLLAVASPNSHYWQRPIELREWGAAWTTFVYPNLKSLTPTSISTLSKALNLLQTNVYLPVYKQWPALLTTLATRPLLDQIKSGEKFFLTKLEMELLFSPHQIQILPGPRILDSDQVPKSAFLCCVETLQTSRVFVTANSPKSDEILRPGKTIDFDFRDTKHPYFRCVKEDKGHHSGVAKEATIRGLRVGDKVKFYIRDLSWEETHLSLLTKVEFEDRNSCFNESTVNLRQRLEGFEDRPTPRDPVWQAMFACQDTKSRWRCFEFTSLMSGTFVLCSDSCPHSALLVLEFRPNTRPDPTKCFGIGDQDNYFQNSLAALRQSMMDPAFLPNSEAAAGYVLLEGKSFYSNRNLLKTVALKPKIEPVVVDQNRRWLNWRVEDIMDSDSEVCLEDESEQEPEAAPQGQPDEQPQLQELEEQMEPFMSEASELKPELALQQESGQMLEADSEMNPRQETQQAPQDTSGSEFESLSDLVLQSQTLPEILNKAKVRPSIFESQVEVPLTKAFIFADSVDAVPQVVYPEFSSCKGTFSVTLALHDQHFNQINIHVPSKNLRVEFVWDNESDAERESKCKLSAAAIRLEKSNLHQIVVQFEFENSGLSGCFQLFNVLLYVSDVPIKYFTVVPSQRNLVQRVQNFRRSRSSALSCSGGWSILINRSQIFQSILSANRTTLTCRSKIKFKGEKAIDVGGPSREFYDLIGMEILRGSMGTAVLQPQFLESVSVQVVVKVLEPVLRSNEELFVRLGIIFGNSIRFNQFVGFNPNKLVREVLLSPISVKVEEIVLRHTQISSRPLSACLAKLRAGFREALHRVPEFFWTFTAEELAFFFTGRQENVEFTHRLLSQHLEVEGPADQERLFRDSLVLLEPSSAQSFWRALTGSSSIDMACPIKGRVSLGNTTGRDLVLHTCGRSASLRYCYSLDDMIALVAACIDSVPSKSTGFNMS